jgi:glutathione S-transferase
VQTYGLQLKPAAMQYVSRLLELESMREWYAAALKEPWRHEEYEAAVRGMLIEDRRSA